MRSSTTTPGRTFRRLGAALAVSVLAVTTGCAADGVTLSPTAVAAMSTTFGHPDSVGSAVARLPIPPRIRLRPADVTQLARIGKAREEVVVEVAQQLDRQPGWSVALQRAKAVYHSIPEYVREPTVNLGCQAATGQFETQADLEEAIAGEAVALGLSRDQAASFRFGVWQLHNGLVKAGKHADPNTRMTVVLLCYGLDQILD